MVQLLFAKPFGEYQIGEDQTRCWMVAGTSISGARLACELTTIIGQRGKPHMIVSDKGTELTSMAILLWSNERRVEWHYTAPGKLRDECLNETRFTSLPHARAELAEWQHDYNTVRPHSQPGGRHSMPYGFFRAKSAPWAAWSPTSSRGSCGRMAQSSMGFMPGAIAPRP